MQKRLATPCKCGWKWTGFHICVDLSAPCPGEYQIKKEGPKRPSGPGKGSNFTRMHQESRDRNRQRDALIKKTYNESELTHAQVAKKLGIPLHTVGRVLRQARMMGQLTRS